ncbi:hypothetical protein ACB092_05G138900 [Castanea dentata]
MDWRERGAITSVKNQSSICLAGIEGLLHNVTGKLVELSVQQLIDCAVNDYTFGCNGGLATRAYTYVRDNKGITLEEDYPFHGFQGPCNQQKATQFQIFQISGCYSEFGSEADLLKAVVGQPVSIDINASSHEFQLYESGVFTGPYGVEPNHVVTAIGYRTSEDGIKYWILKNS